MQNSPMRYESQINIYHNARLPNVIDLEQRMDIFLARRSNQVPSFWPPDARLEKVLDFCIVLISIVVILTDFFILNIYRNFHF